MAGGKLYQQKKRRYKKKRAAPKMSLMNKRDAVILPSLSSNSVLPNKLKRTLRYSSKFTINSNIGQAGTYVFRANSCYDPDLSGVGHQPRGFDQLISMYDHYQVIGSKITIATVQPNISGVVGIALKDSDSVSTDYEDYMETRGPNSVYGLISTNGEHVGLDLSYSQSKFFGTGELDDKYQGSASQNPPDGAYFHVWNSAITDTATMNCSYIVNVDYIVMFTEPDQPVKS